MVNLGKITDVARKFWTIKKWDEYKDARNTKAIERAVKAYEDPTNKLFDEVVDKAGWKLTIDKKVNYLLARKPICAEAQEKLDELSDFIKEAAKEYLLRGSIVWIVQGNDEDILPTPAIMKNTIVVYKDEAKEEPLAYIRKYVDVEVDPLGGAETEITYLECYYVVDNEGEVRYKRDTYCSSLENRDRYGEELEDMPLFIELGKTGDAPLFAYVEKYLGAFDNIFKHQDKTVDKNTKPLVEVRGYSGTSDEDLAFAIEEQGIARVDGNGGVAIHPRQMDSTSVDLWRKALTSRYTEAAAIVAKDNELNFAQSGKALDRLFVDMENSARELAHTLEIALAEYFSYLGYEDIEIIWNTDRPVDDASIITSIAQSRGIISDETLLEQHPWVDDVEREKARLQTQQAQGFEDFIDQE